MYSSRFQDVENLLWNRWIVHSSSADTDSADPCDCDAAARPLQPAGRGSGLDWRPHCTSDMLWTIRNTFGGRLFSFKYSECTYFNLNDSFHSKSQFDYLITSSTISMWFFKNIIFLCIFVITLRIQILLLNHNSYYSVPIICRKRQILKII